MCGPALKALSHQHLLDCILNDTRSQDATLFYSNTHRKIMDLRRRVNETLLQLVNLTRAEVRNADERLFLDLCVAAIEDAHTPKHSLVFIRSSIAPPSMQCV